MSVFSSLTNRLFLAMALLAVVSIGAATTRDGRGHGAGRGRTETRARGGGHPGRGIPQPALRALHARSARWSPTCRASRRGGAQRSADGAADRRRLPEAARRRPAGRHQPARARCSREIALDRQATGIMRRCLGADPGHRPGPAGDPRHADRRVRARRTRRRAVPGAHQQRDRLRSWRRHPGRRRCRPRPGRRSRRCSRARG